MKQNRVRLALALLPAFLISAHTALAQGGPTATQPLQLSAFGGMSGVFTGLGEGKNLSLTAGVDLALQSHHGIRPVLEIRGTYPMAKGMTDAQKSVLGGLRADFFLGHRLHPYANFLFGRGATDYPGGYIYSNYLYNVTTTNVYSPGGGADFDLTERFAVKLDGQFQLWSGAPTPSGNVYSKAGTLGVVYRFDFNHHYKR